MSRTRPPSGASAAGRGEATPAGPVGPARGVLGALGVLVMGYGAWLLLSRQDPDQVLAVALWLGAGVVLHDAVLSAVVLVLGLLTVRLLPALVRGPVAAGVVVLGTLTVMAVPVLGGFGARADNPTLLDRSYLLGWLGLAVLIAVAVAVAVALRVRRARPGRSARRR